ncbi:MAG: hypothetical protein ABS911_03650 [Carnobacterium sp.]|uniref:hypothetical protein n=1 Tax=Carnobacterium sp. TaxID=48221 RepID=UPI00331509E9
MKKLIVKARLTYTTMNQFGSTAFKNAYAAGDSNAIFEEQLVHSASSGSKVASGMVKEIAFENFITDI